MCLLILVWEDGFCNFAASGAAPEINSVELNKCRLIGKVAADHSHKWIYKEPNEQEINFLTWEAQFQSRIKTIAFIAVREGVVQLGAIHKVLSLLYIYDLK
ncbi:hypothetical protein HN51_058780 [Arachis hypogaea]